MPAPEVRCRSWRIRGLRIVRCSWEASHTIGSKWHCHEPTGHAWRVVDRWRPKPPDQAATSG
ncbi:hypothetical protein AB0K09_15755 [Streptomyces sp. NPDC049577]|uniref:hypothetical protein n=1 Tax=Streptomyces sp. NPDC049577 TaxID=3155153 RepID=UPI003445158A